MADYLRQTFKYDIKYGGVMQVTANGKNENDKLQWVWL